MKDKPLASIIVNNYNYDRFLQDATDSALNQTYSNVEVIVVDDGSTDNSREIIGSYSKQIIPILKQNGGQASAFNAGLVVSQGEVIIFLDSDDMLLPTAVAKAVKKLWQPEVVKVHWYQWEIDSQSKQTGQKYPDTYALGEGNFREKVIRQGTVSETIAPTSGNAWKRSFLEAIYPVPELGNKYCADGYLCRLAPLFGKISLIAEPQGCYRVHGENYMGGGSLFHRVQRNLYSCEILFPILREYLQKQGIIVDSESWKKLGTPYDWMTKILALPEDIKPLISTGEKFIFVDEAQLEYQFLGQREAIPFLARDGKYWGAPPDDETAIQELERLRCQGASFIVFIWSSFWWLDYYCQFHQYLLSYYKCLLQNDRCLVFDLR